ncbi:hypothetical protein CC1G_15086 [Coprinopsis cinerea okayama7|uniref:Uncharacterized protein n=1 Tax=Coprinopsis cinerea (strain Okayama-7 / 130 / ATCC MYA-4618 / FGSC 9003) TaxID=240176 RepID=D6RPF3_COPC7|nr:hypothetical protein CC1G_15086 [Coprinopsis cinerea okayama7\|eukprot:XP_002910752.1 hypothetical protein CC1G_15086 [Coprinopsis cinerea okayama7\
MLARFASLATTTEPNQICGHGTRRGLDEYISLKVSSRRAAVNWQVDGRLSESRIHRTTLCDGSPTHRRRQCKSLLPHGQGFLGQLCMSENPQASPLGHQGDEQEPRNPAKTKILPRVPCTFAVNRSYAAGFAPPRVHEKETTIPLKDNIETGCGASGFWKDLLGGSFPKMSAQQLFVGG